ncbi:MAG TPA: hypothetical protein ENJ82_04585 [Bacteroidetes bacterium]|nr:hypothetical protein [Bacteroidota bacterium]
MKFIVFYFFLILGSLNLNAQNIQYKTLYDQPPHPRFNVNVDLINLDMGVKNLDGTSANIGTFGFYEPVEGIGAQFNIKKSIFALGKMGYKDYPGNLDVSLGGYLMLQNKSRKKPTKVSLNKEYKGSQYSTNVYGDRVETRTELETFVKVPANRFIQRGVRAGYYMKRGPFKSDEFGEEMSLTSIGLYAGITARSIKNVFIETAKYGIKYNSVGDDIALDFLFVPVNVFRDLNNNKENISPAVKTALGNFPLGFRIGWYRYQVEQKARTGKKFGGAISAEAGYKPYQGFFINASYAITMVKK